MLIHTAPGELHGHGIRQSKQPELAQKGGAAGSVAVDFFAEYLQPVHFVVAAEGSIDFDNSGRTMVPAECEFPRPIGQKSEIGGLFLPRKEKMAPISLIRAFFW